MRWLAGLLGLLVCALCRPPAAAQDRRPVLWLIGDSTVNNPVKGQQGWGTPLRWLLDPAKVELKNKAIGGRSSRSFHRDHWDAVRREIRAGDWLIVQFGHNDGGGLRQSGQRASLKGNGDETEEYTDAKTGATETVHSYGWYLRQFCQGARNAGARVIVCSQIPRNLWTNGKVGREAERYGKWAKEAATAAGALFVDLNELVAVQFEAAGPEKVKAELFQKDHTHPSPAGARLCAECVARGLLALQDAAISSLLLPESQWAANLADAAAKEPAN